MNWGSRAEWRQAIPDRGIFRTQGMASELQASACDIVDPNPFSACRSIADACILCLAAREKRLRADDVASWMGPLAGFPQRTNRPENRATRLRKTDSTGISRHGPHPRKWRSLRPVFAWPDRTNWRSAPSGHRRHWQQKVGCLILPSSCGVCLTHAWIDAHAPRPLRLEPAFACR